MRTTPRSGKPTPFPESDGSGASSALEYVLGPEHGQSIERLALRTSRACAAVAASLGMLAILALALGLDGLLALMPLKFNTALALTAAGIGLLACTIRGPRATAIAALSGAIAMAIGLLVLLQIATGCNLGVDELFVSDPTPAPGKQPGRMAAHTAIACTGSGLAILLLDARWRARAWNSHVLAGGVAAIALFTLAGHLYRGDRPSETSLAAGMTVSAAVAFLFLALGIFAARPYSGIGELLFSPTLTSNVARRWLVGAAIFPLALGYVAVQLQQGGILDPATASALFVGTVTVLLATAVVAESAASNRLEGRRLELERERVRLVTELGKALAEVRSLSGLLPICTHCKRIRDDEGGWERLEEYISERSEAEFSHSLCPDCLQKHYGELF